MTKESLKSSTSRYQESLEQRSQLKLAYDNKHKSLHNFYFYFLFIRSDIHIHCSVTSVIGTFVVELHSLPLWPEVLLDSADVKLSGTDVGDEER